ncbi:MAG: putative Ig domain-containing protein [Alistipes sp.]
MNRFLHKCVCALSACAAFVAAMPCVAQQSAETLVPDLSAYILTPKPSPAPRINGARVFGLRPNSKCLYTIAASGERPMTFAVSGLPKGLVFDAEHGRITGSVKKCGTYKVTVTATNAKGSASRELRIVVGDRIALTPPMGWNSWNCCGRDVTQEHVVASARAMVESGLANHGWTYINIDDGWQGRRGGKYNAIQPNAKFPDMAALTREIHDMGLKLGIYSAPWVGTYGAHIGSYSDNPDGENQWIKDGLCNENYRYQKPEGDFMKYRREFYKHGKYSFVRNDVEQWKDWEIDYLKYDWSPLSVYHTKEMHDALRSCDRDIVFSLSNSAPIADAPVWAEYADTWRTTGDIRDTWKSISSIGFSQDRWSPFCRPGSWPDADMLVVGLVGWGPKLHYTKLTVDEQYTHISLWAMLSSPLLIGCDMARMDDFTLSLLTNDEVIDINQDPLGLHAVPVWSDGEGVVYLKNLEDGSVAVGLFNRGDAPAKMSINLRMLGMYEKKTVRDVWRQKDIATLDYKQEFTTEVASHGVVLLRVYPGNTRDRREDKVVW